MSKINRGMIKNYTVSGTIYIVLFLIILYPIGRLFFSSFFTDVIGEVSQFTLGNYQSIFDSRAFITALKNTMIMSSVAVLLSTPLGVFLAWFVARTDMPFKKVIEPLNLIPFFLPSLVFALSWAILAAPKSGMLNHAAQALFGLSSPPFNIYSLSGMSLLIGLAYTPYVYLFTIGSLQNMDPALEEAARMNGASILQTALRITLPLAGPAILSASVLTFILTAGIFGIPLLLGPPGRLHTISTLIYQMINLYPPRYGAAAALSVVLLILTVLLVFLQRKILAKRHFWTVTGKGYRPALVSLGRGRWIAFGLNLGYLVLTLLPIINLLFISLLPGWEGELKFDFSLKNYVQILFVNDVTRRSFFNSLMLGTVGATFGVLICALLANLIQRTRMPGRGGIDFVAMLPVTYPGVVLGMGFLVAWIKTPIYGTIWILMLAYIVHFMPTALRSIEATLGSISPALDESARIAGASWLGAFRWILFPLMWPGFISAWLLLFVIFMREVSSSLLLYVHGTETLSIALIQIMEYESQGVTAAFGIIQTLIILAAVYFFRKISARQKLNIEVSD
jgi:iron(III) transport system permease protein